MKQKGILVVSLRGVNFGFWSRLGCSGQSANILSRQGLVYGSAKNTELREEKQKSNFLFSSFFFLFEAVSFRGQNLLMPHPDGLL